MNAIPNADKCIVGDPCLALHEDNRQVNVLGFDPKAGSKLACIADAAIANSLFTYLFDQPSNSNEGPRSSFSLPHAMLRKLGCNQ